MIHNALVRATEVQRGAKVAFGLDAGEGGLERLSESIQVTKDFWAHPTDAFLRGERWCQGVVSVAAGGVGNYSAVAFTVATAGWIAQLERIRVSSGTGGTIVLRRGLQLPNAVTSKVFRDMRAVAAPPIGRLTYVNNVAVVPGGTECHRARVLADTALDIPLDWVLVDGGPVATEVACVVYHATANVDLFVTAWWRERALLPGEQMR